MEESTLWQLATQIGATLSIPSRAVLQEAYYQAQTSPCTAAQILTAWEATARKGGVPRQLKNYIHTPEVYPCAL